MRRYVEVEFKPGGKRYTYHFDGDGVIEAGDRVEISTRDGAGTFKVQHVHTRPPSYNTKPIAALLARPAPEAFDPQRHTGDPSAQ